MSIARIKRRAKERAKATGRERRSLMRALLRFQPGRGNAVALARRIRKFQASLNWDLLQ